MRDEPTTTCGRHRNRRDSGSDADRRLAWNLEIDRRRRRAGRAYLSGRVVEAVDLYAQNLGHSGTDLASLAALDEIARLLGRIGRADPDFAMAKGPLRQRLLQVLRDGASVTRESAPVGSDPPGA